MSNFQFDQRWLALLWVVAFVVVAGIYGIWQRRRALRLFAEPGLLPVLAPRTGWLRPLMRLGLLALTLLLLVAALINPRWGAKEQQITRRNIDVMVLLDVSRSMLARDIAPNRLERAKISIRDDLLPALGGDRIGLITFAGAAALACPLTSDYGFFRLALDDVTTRSAPRGGTLIGDAIRKAVAAFPDKLNTHKIVILITDGEDHESFPVEAAAAAWEEHEIPIVAIALGDETEGARIPVESDRGQRYLTHEGEVVWTRANFEDLRRIAATSPISSFVPVGTQNFDLGEVYRRVVVPQVEIKEHQELETVPLPSRYHSFALAALVLLLIESLWRDGPRRAAATAESRVEKGAAA